MDWTSIGQPLRVGGHRGASGLAPENTMAAFRLAADLGVDYLELDVRLTRDGVPVVFHDDRLDDRTDGTGAIERLTAAQVRRLDAGSRFGAGFAGERVPFLAEVLELIVEHGRLGATIEAKGEGTGPVIARAIVASPAVERLSICSFDAAELRAAAEIAPGVARVFIADRDRPDADLLEETRAATSTACNLPLDWCSPELVEGLHAAGLLVTGGTIDDVDGIRRAIALGIDACDSNRPDVAVPARDGTVGSRASVRSAPRAALTNSD